MTQTEKVIMKWLIDQMSTLSASEKNMIIKGEGKLSILSKKPKPVRSHLKSRLINGKSTLEFDEISIKLFNASSREEARQIISDSNLSRSDLERLIRKLDLPFNKSFNNERLIDVIVERTVGFRINSSVIQGKLLEE